MLVARRLLVTGRVQGVGFRLFAHETARREGLTGWVRNLTDGGVELFAAGDREAVDRFERRIRLGPAGSRVDAVVVSQDTPTGRAGGFQIRP